MQPLEYNYLEHQNVAKLKLSSTEDLITSITYTKANEVSMLHVDAFLRSCYSFVYLATVTKYAINFKKLKLISLSICCDYGSTVINMQNFNIVPYIDT